MRKHSASRVRRGRQPLARVAGTLLLVAWCSAAAAQPRPPAPADVTSAGDPLEYRLHAGETPGEVAELFRIPLDDLLQTNGIRDASRLRVGAVLRIPDPRAAAVDALRAERSRLEGTVGALRTELVRRQDHVDALEAEVRDAAGERAALQRRLTGYTTLRAVAVVAVGAALGLTVALLLALSYARDEHRRRVAVVKNTEILRDAVERYRSLGAQLELKYQNLYRQNGAAARPGSAAGALLAGYERERAWVEQEISRSEAAIDEAVDEMQVA